MADDTDTSDLQDGKTDEATDESVKQGAANERLTEPPADDVIEEIEKERERRLDSANRPEGAEIDNSDVTLPTVAAFNAEQEDTAAGTSDPAESFRENPPSEEEIKEIEEERARRLADANRPEGAVIDNTVGDSPASPDE